MEEKSSELRILHDQINDLKQTLEDERGKNVTLELELLSTQAEVHSTMDQCSTLNTEMEQKSLNFVNEVLLHMIVWFGMLNRVPQYYGGTVLRYTS